MKVPLPGRVALSLMSPVAVQALDLIVIVCEKGSGDPVEGATVDITESEVNVTTDSHGQAVFADPSLAAQLKILAAGYDTRQEKVLEGPASGGDLLGPSCR